MREQPPKWIRWFLEKTCSENHLDELEGDLLELFERDVNRVGLKSAKRRMVLKALASVRWYRLPKMGSILPSDMQYNFLKVSFRHALKHPSTSLVQLSGLILGLTAFLYIALFIKNELAYDQMHKNRTELYRVLKFDPTTGDRNHATSSRHGKALTQEFPFTKLCRFGNDPVKLGESDPLFVEDFFWSDSTFFQLFTFPFVHGDPLTCLSEKNSMVLTRRLSLQVFGTDDVLNELIKVKVYDGDHEYLMKITGIVEDPPQHSHIQFQALGSMSNAEDLYANLVGHWGFSWLRTYIQIPEGRLADIEAGIPRLIKNHLGDDPPATFGMQFQPFDKVYLHSQDIPKNTFAGSISNLRIFGTIGILILMVSLMNYINLATARTITRSKEVGIRKVLGTNKKGIVSQFLFESLLLVLTSGVLATMLITWMLPTLNSMFDLRLTISLLDSQDVLGILSLFLTVGLLAGLLPSWAMTKLSHIGESNVVSRLSPGRLSLTRKLFVGAQYAVALGLLVCSLVVSQQYRFLKNFEKGFDAEQLVHITIDDKFTQEKIPLLKDRIKRIAGVWGCASTGEDLPSELKNTWDLNWSGKDPEQRQGIDVVGIDKDYFDLLNLDFVSGSNFIHDFAVDSARSVVLNEKAQERIGIEQIVGQQVTIGGRLRRVIGVIEDHHNTSLHTEIVPIAYFIFPPGYRVSPDNLLIKLDTDELSQSLSQIERVWNEISPEAFAYNFVDQAFEEAYRSEERFSTLMGGFTGIAIVISVIGLFGLISFIAQQKLKEISLRKVLGASYLNLIQILSRDFVVVFVMASLVTLPLAHHFMDAWLSHFIYRIPVNFVIFLVAIVACMTLSMIVLSFHLYRTAGKNPADVLSQG